MARLGRIKVMAIFGTRPEAIKMAPVVEELKEYPEAIQTVVAVTAQHREMLDQVLELFGISPDYDLDIMREGQSLSEIITRSVMGLEEPIVHEAPQLVLVHGDTATTFGGSLISFYHQIPVGHVEAGLRTDEKYNPFPEEMNRRLTGVVADLHFAPLPTHKANLIRENVPEERIFVTGNTVIDALFAAIEKPYGFSNPELQAIDFENKRVLLVTAHRRENLGGPLRNICLGLRDIIREFKETELVFPVHMNPLVRGIVWDILGREERVHLIDPVDYHTMVNLMRKAYLVLTDSGGLQEEAPSLGKPVLVLREVTERPEGLGAGTLRLVGTSREGIAASARLLLESEEEYRRMASSPNPYGDGRASSRIVQAILYYFGLRSEPPEQFVFPDRHAFPPEV